MNTEEEFARLRDESLWAVAPLAPRADVHVRRARGWVLQFAIPVVAGAAIAAVVLVGGSALRTANHPIAAAPSSAAPAAWTPTPVFGGDCAALFSSGQVSSMLGVAATNPAPLYESGQEWDQRPDSQIIDHNDGLACVWQDSTATGDGSTTPWLQVAVLPASAVPEVTDLTKCDSPIKGYCRFVFLSHGYLLTGNVYGNLGYDTALQSISTTFDAVSAAAPAPPTAWTRGSRDWPAQVDCSAVAVDSGLESTLGNGAWVGTNSDVQSFFYLALKQLSVGHGLTQCGLTSGNSNDSSRGYLSVDVLSGGAWLEQGVAQIPGAKIVTVAGADRAIVVPRSDSEDNPGFALYVFSGTNCVELYSTTITDITRLYPAVAGIVRTLDSL